MKGNAMSKSRDPRPWSTKKPQNFVLSVVLIIVAIMLVRQGLDYIDQGVGGFVPYAMILGGPTLAAYYTWYFTIRKFEGE